MNVQHFQQFMAQQGLRPLGSAACGQIKGYPVMTSFMNAGWWKIVFNAAIPDWKGVEQELKPLLKGMANITYENEALTANLKVSDKSYAMVFPNVVNNIVSVLLNRGITPSPLCPVCGTPSCDTMVLYRDAYRPVHNGCMEQIAQEVQRKTEENLSHGSYATGILGAILGMIVGIIPSLLTIIFTETIYAILFALIPLAIYFGYKLCKGKLNKTPLVLSIVLSILSVYLIEIILLIYAVASELGLSTGMSMTIAFQLLGNGDTWAAMTQDAATSFVFIALGIFISWGYISRTAHSSVKEVQAVMSTRLPYAGFSVQQPQVTGVAPNAQPFDAHYPQNSVVQTATSQKSTAQMVEEEIEK